MNPDETAARPTPDPRFPNGLWTGFFLQYWLPGRQRTDQAMTFEAGTLTGHGRDRVGPYTVNGTYDPMTGRCEWIKKYRHKHRVAYRGVNDGRGIWGVWEIRLLGGLYQDHGGFHLWPAGSDMSEESDRTEQACRKAMRAEFGNRTAPPGAALLVVLFGLVIAAAIWALQYWLL